MAWAGTAVPRLAETKPSIKEYILVPAFGLRRQSHQVGVPGMFLCQFGSFLFPGEAGLLFDGSK
jgi:hypothetical protein